MEIKTAISQPSDKALRDSRPSCRDFRQATQANGGQIARMTSAPGHKASQHLIEEEAYRRIMSGQAPETLAEFAQQLLDWLRETYPGAAPATLNTVENQIRETWHRRHEMIRGG